MPYSRRVGIFVDMTRSALKKSAVVAVLLLTGLLFTQFARLPAPMDTQESRFAEKVNLALRRTAHHLLAESGDSTSSIAPVERMGNTFLIRLERPFDYNRLPVLLKESFQVHDIQANYDVAVLNCVDGLLQLGYNVQDVQTGEGVPCGGREQDGDCYNLEVIFTHPAKSSSQSIGWWILASSFLLSGFSYALWQWATPKKSATTAPLVSVEEVLRLPFGNSSLDVANQTLLVGSVQHQLTYREAKLLHLFVSHLQQLLERDFILQSVWNDEGIIVGRSVDVFVSRLRKMLRDDPTVRIATVHGVGYRLELVADKEA